MKYIPFFFLFFLVLSCGEQKDDYTANSQLSAQEQEELLRSVIRYLGKLPGKGNYDVRFDPRFNDHYEEQVRIHRVDLYYQDPATSDIYFMASRIAPSIQVKRVGIGIHIRRVGDEISYYNEVFRTWKMPEEELAEKGAMLFDKMVKKEDLWAYYPQNSGEEEYIEFPDPNTRFDTEKRAWVSDLEDPMAPYYQLKPGIRDSM